MAGWFPPHCATGPHLLELGRHLERGPSHWRLRVAGDLTKTGQADNSLLPITLTPWIDLYVSALRSILNVRCRKQDSLSNRLWIGLDGRPLSGHLIRERVKLRTKKAFGFPICPHAFRKIAATTFILERPEYALYGPALLGHRSADTIHKHYFVSQQQLAIRIYHNLRDSRGSDDRSGASAKGHGTRDRQIRALLVCASSPPGRHRTRRPRQRD
jgi:integrase